MAWKHNQNTEIPTPAQETALTLPSNNALSQIIYKRAALSKLE